jgi:hypothetical protein
MPAHSGDRPKMAQMASAAGKFLDQFDTNNEEKHNLCLPSAGPPSKSLGAWAPLGPPSGGLKKKPGSIAHSLLSFVV